MKAKKILASIITIVILFACFGLLANKTNVNAAALTDEQMVNLELNNINLPSQAIIDFPLTNDSVYGSTIEWTSSNPSVITVSENNWAKVTRPSDANVTVTLTVTLTQGAYSNSKEFEITVLKGTTVTNTYSVNYVLNNPLAVNALTNPETYNVGTTPAIAAPTCGTLAFLGWYLNESLTGDVITTLPNGSSGDVTLYAKWAEDTVTSISVETLPTKVSYKALETFDKTGMVVKAIYASGKEETVENYSVDKTVLHPTDTLVTVSLNGKEATVNVSVVKIDVDMSGVVFANKEVTYNGLVQSIEATNLPNGVSAVYAGSATNASATSYTVTATFSLTADMLVDYNVPEQMTAQLTINKASYDMSSVVFANASKTYNGVVQSIEATNLPVGVSAEYSEGQANVGLKEITVTFSVADSVNYNVPASMKATLTITKAPLTVTADSK